MTIINSLKGTLSPVPSTQLMRVEVFDAAGICGDLIDVSQADAAGQFDMQLSSDYLGTLLTDGTPSLVFRIFESGQLVPQEKNITWTVAQRVTELHIPLGSAAPTAVIPTTPVATSQSLVRGTVDHGDGTPAAGVIVRA